MEITHWRYSKTFLVVITVTNNEVIKVHRKTGYTIIEAKYLKGIILYWDNIYGM